MKRYLLVLSFALFAISGVSYAADLDFNWNIPNIQSFTGVETDGQSIYTVRWNGATIRQLDKTGKDVDSFTIAGVTNLRDLACDGQYFYGGSAKNTIYIMDFKNRTLIGTINSPNQTVCSIAYDPTADAGKGGFWVGNWDTYSFSLVSRSGLELNSLKYDQSTIPGIFGSAFDNTTPGGPYLWCLHANSGLAPFILRIHIPTGTVMSDIIEVAPAGNYGGGLCLTNTLFPGKNMLIGTIQGVSMFGIDLNRVLISSPDDAGILSVNLNQYIKVGDVTISGVLTNSGTNADITSFDLNWQAGSGPISTSSITGVDIKRFQNYNFTHPTNWNATAGQYKVKVWVSNVNGGKDLNTKNDTLSTSVIVYNQTAPKKVLFEEFSTTACGYCPDGHLVLDGIIQKYPDNIVPIIHHAGYGTDAMTTSEDETYATEYAAGAPTAAVDRKYIKQSRDVWESLVVNESEIWSPVSLSIDNTFDNSTRKAIATIKVKFIDVPVPGDMRLNLFLIEDKVTGTGNGYDQANYYNTTQGHPMYGKGNPIVGYVHRHVMRKAITPVWGDQGVIPNSPNINDEFTKQYTFTVDPKFNLNNLKLVAFASYYTALSTNRNVINAEQADLSLTTGVDETTPNNEFLSIGPNPVENISTVTYKVNTSANVSIVLFNQLGQQVAIVKDGYHTQGEYNAEINASGLSSGSYRLVMTIGTSTTSIPVNILK